MALRVHVMAVAAQRKQVEGSARSPILHPNDMMKLQRDDVSARGTCALVAGLAQNLIAYR
jgi:hypothetical protein